MSGMGQRRGVLSGTERERTWGAVRTWEPYCITQGKKWFRDGSATIPCRQPRFLVGNESNAVMVMAFKKK